MSRTLVLAAFFATAFAANNTNGTEDLDDNTTPMFVASAFSISITPITEHFFTVPPRRAFIITLPLGMTAMTAGFILRVIYANPPFTLGKYIAMDMFILLSPCLFLATNYMLLSHLAQSFDEEVAERCLPIRRSRITKIFVWSDVTTFLVQSGGGGLTAMRNNISLAKLGTKVALVGLVLQALSFGLFTIVLIIFARRVSIHFPELKHPKNARPFKVFSRQPIDDWRIVVYIMCATCVGILIRSVFRIAEFAGGYSGVISTHEGYFYVFDSLPLWIAMTLYCVVWPTRALMMRSEGLELGYRQKIME
ncbi:RTA1 like protein-domain-containing protein [Mycena galopus ATCC 62051]|nr:RTA1 like protein-domain-containing protein [Mycena galopus ATCC 62051]